MRFMIFYSTKTDINQKDKINPKRMQRSIKKQLATASIGTKAQQTLKLQHENNKLIRKEKTDYKKKKRNNINLI